MISVVVCSRNTDFLLQVKRSISSTIGVVHEFLVWDNNAEPRGICEVYNRMAKQARYDIICFVHEDVLFNTLDWGEKLRSIFELQPEIGVIGVAGSKYKSRYSSGWYTSIKEFDCANIVHRSEKGEQVILLRPDNKYTLENVVCLDGVFICCRKSIWMDVMFNEADLTGFHFYDIDFTLRATRVCSVAVTFEIPIVHITHGGDFGNAWVKTSIEYHCRNRNMLPQSVNKNIDSSIDIKILKTWLDVLKQYRISWSNKLRWLTSQKLLFKPNLYYHIIKFLFYKPMKMHYFHKLIRRK